VPRVVTGLERSLAREYQRFEFVARDVLEDVLSELEISQLLGSRDGQLELGRLSTAEVLLTGRVERIDQQAVGLSAEVVSSETAKKLAFVDVAGPVEDTEQLAEDLAALLVQAYPRAPGVITEVLGPTEAVTTLGRVDGVTGDMRCLIYVYGPEEINPLDGTSMGRRINVVDDGRLFAVQDRLSRVERISAEEAEQQPFPDVEQGDFIWVITK